MSVLIDQDSGVFLAQVQSYFYIDWLIGKFERKNTLAKRNTKEYGKEMQKNNRNIAIYG